MSSTRAVAVRALVVVMLLGGALFGPEVSPSLAQGVGPPPPGQGAPRDRAQLERQLRERFARVVQQRLRLTDAQMARLRQTNAKYEPKRRELQQRERETRVALRGEVLADSAANQQHVAQLITDAIGIQRQRLDLVDAEQKELAQFLTPLQRARYLDLQEKVRQRVEQLRRAQQARADSGLGFRRPFGAGRAPRP